MTVKQISEFNLSSWRDNLFPIEIDCTSTLDEINFGHISHILMSLLAGLNTKKMLSIICPKQRETKISPFDNCLVSTS